jgi:hypothetical protein
MTPVQTFTGCGSARGITDNNLWRPTRRAKEHYTKVKLSTRRGGRPQHWLVIPPPSNRHYMGTPKPPPEFLISSTKSASPHHTSEIDSPIHANPVPDLVPPEIFIRSNAATGTAVPAHISPSSSKSIIGTWPNHGNWTRPKGPEINNVRMHGHARSAMGMEAMAKELIRWRGNRCA